MNHPSTSIRGGASLQPTPANNVGGGRGLGDGGWTKGGTAASEVCVFLSLSLYAFGLVELVGLPGGDKKNHANGVAGLEQAETEAGF
ncbi:hypothetical protein P168DRAFT_291196 [Aspergillus campestris IBT 28561]|uniref:Uncharacterized protein n=1 Tax=Aspergillus campestris (strain IBT 28561) TaxID=1392248 RepID=A0A2I1CZI7_ASPC2|nr:uncharacterized protein P168DRAFT_291196 [Aspergillus campestris IBT 28561]PKY03039.1 hypothetical protein P168DRAFT_291196 [Aspergillus campestris IBT 28561]